MKTVIQDYKRNEKKKWTNKKRIHKRERLIKDKTILKREKENEHKVATKGTSDPIKEKIIYFD